MLKVEIGKVYKQTHPIFVTDLVQVIGYDGKNYSYIRLAPSYLEPRSGFLGNSIFMQGLVEVPGFGTPLWDVLNPLLSQQLKRP